MATESCCTSRTKSALPERPATSALAHVNGLAYGGNNALALLRSQPEQPERRGREEQPDAGDMEGYFMPNSARSGEGGKGPSPYGVQTCSRQCRRVRTTICAISSILRHIGCVIESESHGAPTNQWGTPHGDATHSSIPEVPVQ